MALLLKIVGGVVLLVIVAVGLAIAIVPRFLDRIYYIGPDSDHFDGARFFNPDGDDTAAPPAGGSRGGFLWRQLSGSDGRPSWPDAVPVAAGKPAERIDGDRMVATWIGHATVLIQTQGLNILTDPVYADRAGPFGFGPRRVAAPGIALADLPRIDLVLVSHNHYDHLDKDTLKRLWERDRPLIVTSFGNDSVIAQTGAQATALDWGQSAQVRPGISVAVTRNHHWGSRWFTDRNRALWSSFVIRLPSGGNVFFAGDTGFGDGNWPAEAAALGPVRLALIPIGAFRFAPGQMSSGSHIGPAEAALVHQRLGATRSIPIHWGTFRLSYEGYDTPPRMLAEAMKVTGGTGFTPVAIGAATDVAPAGAVGATPPMDRADMMRRMDTPAVKALR
ncbi:Zn-dependent hydrolase [Sphingomonas sp. Leaf412]|uniref:MBL fold metallo-hydrolase n=1 Tax=Sphingomonas sp. Leaf412 TaxID=1736370 RepID=UPI00070126FF|nr:MBL fold metallo-hydrolase [Sphingomonas sp. Leaf412]KQT33473.1 Zn-dependent hydrolase [Sphingomonas sp. Leaf412]